MAANTSFLPEGLWTYIQQNSMNESDALLALRQETELLAVGDWQVPPEQGQFLTFLTGLTGARSVLEIGTFTGYGTLCMAVALPDGGRVVTLEGIPEYSDIGEKHWKLSGVSERIDLRLGMALDTLAVLLDEGMAGTFDFVFVDADKKEYDDYYEYALQLVRVGGLIAVDNMLWRGAVADLDDQKNSTKSIRTLTQKIRDDERVSNSLVPIGDGLMLALRLK